MEDVRYQFDAETLVYSYYSQETTSNSNPILTLIDNCFHNTFDSYPLQQKIVY